MKVPISHLFAAYQKADTALASELSEAECLGALDTAVKITTILNRATGSIEVSEAEVAGCQPFLAVEPSKEPASQNSGPGIMPLTDELKAHLASPELAEQVNAHRATNPHGPFRLTTVADGGSPCLGATDS